MPNQGNLANRQHYHMRAILKNFSIGETLSIYYKDGRSGSLSYEDPAFYGYKAWSDETETKYGATIESKGLGQIRHILKNHSVSAHQDITNYYFFWRLRHMYAVSPEPDTSASESQEAKDWANRNHKMYINGDGTISGMFAATHGIRENILQYSKEYGETFWQIGISENDELISADCYRRMLFPLSPRILLLGIPKKVLKLSILNKDEIAEVNQIAKDECHSFCFGRPSSDPLG